MSGTLYSLPVLRLAAQSGDWPLLGPPAARSSMRAPLCGSRLVVDVALDAAGNLGAIGIEAAACALGQAAATLVARHAPGRTPAELARASDLWRQWLDQAGDALPDWPELEVLAEVRAFPARHAAVRLPFEAAVAAASEAQGDTARGGTSR